MDIDLTKVIVLTFVINVIMTLAYSVRLVGVKTGKLLISFSLFNILQLVARTSHAFQAPLFASRIDDNINAGIFEGITLDFRLVLGAATVGTLFGALLLPTFFVIFQKAVLFFSRERSIPGLILRLFTKRGLKEVEKAVRMPSAKAVNRYRSLKDLPYKIILMNTVAVTLITVGVLATLYAGYIVPNFRLTTASLTAVVTGIATIFMFVFVDPFMAGMTEDVVAGRESEGTFRRCIFYLVSGRLVGTILAQFVLIPAAHVIAWFAQVI